MAFNHDRSDSELNEGGPPPRRVSKSDLEFWKATLSGAPQLLELPTDRPRPAVMSYAGGRVPVLLTAEVTAGIRRLNQRHGTTLFMTLLSAWSILLARLTGQRDLVIGCANPLALRVRLTPEQRVAELLLQIKESTLAAHAHRDVALMQIVDALELPCELSYHPIFQVMLALDPGDDLEEEQIKAKFDLTLALTDNGNSISGFMEYASDLFDRSTITRMARQLHAVFEALITNDRQYLGAPNLLSQSADPQPVAAAELDSATQFLASALQRRETEFAGAAVAGGHIETIDVINPPSQRSSSVEVEGNAASSAAVLGSIRNALERMGAIQDPLNADEPAHLLIRLEGKTAVWHLLGKRTTIGRTAENDVRIDAEFISRHHAVALREGTDTVIEDLKSTNGTYVNGERISRRTLRNGDVVTLGTMEFHFSHDQSRA